MTIKPNTYHGAIETIEYRQTRRVMKFRGAAASNCAQCADHRVVVDGAKTNDAMATPVRDEDFPRRRHHGDTIGFLQCAGGSRQLPHPRAIQRPQHHHPTGITKYYEEKIFVGGERQAVREFELAGLITLRAYSALPLALYLGRL